MKLNVHDQILVSSIDADSLRPGQVVEVDDDLGKELLERHPAVFSKHAAAAKADKAAPANKARKAAPANKSAKGKR